MCFSEEINELIEDFSFFDSWEDKYQYLIDIGRNVPQMDETLKIEENKLKGCQSVVYFYKYYNDDGTITFLANSNFHNTNRWYIVGILRKYHKSHWTFLFII